MINKISNFVENIRIESASKLSGHRTPVRDDNQPSTSRRRTSQGESLRSGGPSTEEKRQREAATRLLVESEDHKASLQPPKGKQPFDLERFIQNIDDDDEFFHVTCHIEQNMRNKIARGEFVDLERLLPKDKGRCGGNIAHNGQDNRVELVSHDGHTYFKSVRDNQITGLRKWEQAFRVYVAIYTEANPERSVEIWQYMHTINVAAASYQWDNVAYYDLTFRQLMAYKPRRSWAKLYNQGWNLAMKDALSNKQSGQSNKSTSKRHNWRDDCCWRYNQNKCHKSDCDFDHRCTYCGGWNHGFFNCRKRLSKNSGGHSAGDKSGNGSKHHQKSHN